MPKYCPSCESEFHDGYSICNDCHMPLVVQPAKFVASADMASRVKAVQSRYADIYKVADSLVTYGKFLKMVAFVGFLLFEGFGVYQLGLGEWSEYHQAAVYLILGIIWGVSVVLVGILAAALGQLIRCVVDTAVNTTPIINVEGKATVLGLKI